MRAPNAAINRGSKHVRGIIGIHRQILYGSAGTVVQVVRRARVETRRVETGLMSAGQVEITSGLTEGDIVVARAGALLREGDPVRAVTASADPK